MMEWLDSGDFFRRICVGSANDPIHLGTPTRSILLPLIPRKNGRLDSTTRLTRSAHGPSLSLWMSKCWGIRWSLFQLVFETLSLSPRIPYDLSNISVREQGGNPRGRRKRRGLNLVKLKARCVQHQ